MQPGGIGEMLARWKPELHPRDKHGKFRDAWGLSDVAKKLVNRILDVFRPATFRSDDHAQAYLDTVSKKKKRSPRQEASLEYFQTEQGNEDIQSALRANHEDMPQVHDLDAMMEPLPNDILLTRVVGAEAFGLPPERIGEVEEWTGKLVMDLGYAPTNIGTPYQVPGPHVTISLVAPKGTRAVVPGGSREVILDREQPFRIMKVEDDGRGGVYVYAMVMPKTRAGFREAPRGLGKELGAGEKAPAIEPTPSAVAARQPPAPQPIPPAPIARPGVPQGIARQIQEEGGEVPLGAGRVIRPETPVEAPAPGPAPPTPVPAVRPSAPGPKKALDRKRRDAERARFQEIARGKPVAAAGAELDELRAKKADNSVIAQHIRAEALHPRMEEIKDEKKRRNLAARLNEIADEFERGNDLEGLKKMRRLQHENGIQLREQAGDLEVDFDPTIHDPRGVVIEPGARVDVIRPGAVKIMDNGDIVHLDRPWVVPGRALTPAPGTPPRRIGPRPPERPPTVSRPPIKAVTPAKKALIPAARQPERDLADVDVISNQAKGALRNAQRDLARGEDRDAVAEDLRRAAQDLRYGEPLQDDDIGDRLRRDRGELNDVRDADVAALQRAADGLEAGRTPTPAPIPAKRAVTPAVEPSAKKAVPAVKKTAPVIPPAKKAVPAVKKAVPRAAAKKTIPPVKKAVPAAPTKDTLDRMLVKDLRLEAKKRGIKIPPATRKAGIVDLIRKHDSAEAKKPSKADQKSLIDRAVVGLPNDLQGDLLKDIEILDSPLTIDDHKNLRLGDMIEYEVPGEIGIVQSTVIGTGPGGVVLAGGMNLPANAKVKVFARNPNWQPALTPIPHDRDLDKMLKKDLDALAREHKIVLPKAAVKAQIVQALKDKALADELKNPGAREARWGAVADARFDEKDLQKMNVEQLKKLIDQRSLRLPRDWRRRRVLKKELIAILVGERVQLLPPAGQTEILQADKAAAQGMRKKDLFTMARKLGIQAHPWDNAWDIVKAIKAAIRKNRGIASNEGLLDLDEHELRDAIDDAGLLAPPASATKAQMIELLRNPPVVDYHTKFTTRIQRLVDGVKSGIKKTKAFGNGAMGITDRVDFGDGGVAVRKIHKRTWGVPAIRQADAEQLSSVVARAIGAETPDIFRADGKTIYMSFVDGKMAGKYGPRSKEWLAAVASPEGRKIGLLDALIGNGDRHEENWMIMADGRPVGIDHGLAFEPRGGGAPVKDPVTGEYLPGDSRGEFYKTFHDGRRWKSHIDYSKKELEEMRKQLVDQRQQFELLGRLDWYDIALGRLDAIIKRATLP